MLFLNLRNFWQSIKRDRILLLILVLGLFLRGLNSTFGSPSLYISNDEAIAHLAAWNMLAEKTPVSIANYTPLGAYIQIPFLIASYLAMRTLGYINNLSDFELFVLTHEGYFLFIPRLISAFFGTLTILVIYKIALVLFRNRQTAVISAFLTAVSFNLVHISHFGRPWSAALFFLVLAAYFSLKNRIGYSLISIALSYGFHQVGMLGLPLILLLARKSFNFVALFWFFISILMIIVFTILTSRTDLISSIVDNQSFLLSGRFLTDLISGNKNLADSAIRTFRQNLSFYFVANFLVTDGVIFLFGLFGVLNTFTRKTGSKIVYYIFAYFIFASLFFHPLLRYLFPVLLLLIPYSAWAINYLFRKRVYFIVGILLVSSLNSIWWNYLFFKKPTFIRAKDWVSEKIPIQAPLYYIGGRLMTFAPNAQAIYHVSSVNPEFKNRLLELLPDKEIENVRNIIYVSNFPGNNKMRQLKNAALINHDGYVIDYYLDPADRVYKLAPKSFKLVQQFKPTNKEGLVRIAEPLFDASWNFPTSDFRKKLWMYGLSDTGPYVDVLQLRN